MKQNSYTVFFHWNFRFSVWLFVCLFGWLFVWLVVLLGYETEYQYCLQNRKYYLEIPNANLLFWNRKTKQNDPSSLWFWNIRCIQFTLLIMDRMEWWWSSSSEYCFISGNVLEFMFFFGNIAHHHQYHHCFFCEFEEKKSINFRFQKSFYRKEETYPEIYDGKNCKHYTHPERWKWRDVLWPSTILLLLLIEFWILKLKFFLVGQTIQNYQTLKTKIIVEIKWWESDDEWMNEWMNEWMISVQCSRTSIEHITLNEWIFLFFHAERERCASLETRKTIHIRNAPDLKYSFRFFSKTKKQQKQILHTKFSTRTSSNGEWNMKLLFFVSFVFRMMMMIGYDLKEISITFFLLLFKFTQKHFWGIWYEWWLWLWTRSKTSIIPLRKTIQKSKILFIHPSTHAKHIHLEEYFFPPPIERDSI